MNILLESFLEQAKDSIGHAAMLLAMTNTLETENELKRLYKEFNYRCVVTEVGGSFGEKLQIKITKSVIGASLNERLIEKDSHDIHALLHATEEAKKGILVNSASSTNIKMKIAIVRGEKWIAVVLFGESSIHPTTGHPRCGLGVMHI